MKRTVSLLLTAALLLGVLAGCRAPAAESEAPVSDIPVTDLASAAFDHSGQEGRDGLEGLYAGENRGELEVYTRNAYQIEDAWEDMAVIRATGASAFEIAVLRMEDEGAAVRAATALMNYISTRQGDFTGYAPAEADMAAKGEILQSGPYAALFICPDPQKASAAVEAALGGRAFHTAGQQGAGGESMDGVKELRDILVAQQGMDGAELEKLDGGNQDALGAYVKDVYGLSPDQWEACAIARDERSAFEVAVIRIPADTGPAAGAPGRVQAIPPAGDVEGKLNAYLDAREAEFDRSTDQARLLHGALVVDADPYMLLLACKDRKGAMEAFAEAAGVSSYGYSQRYRYLDTDPDYPERCLFTPPNQDDMSIYDTSAIRAAWEKGDPSGLSDYDRDIYDAAKKILGEVLKDGMSDYEKEKAIYGWIVFHVDYDWSHQDGMKGTPRESFTPYGGLVKQVAICLGYATSFQLLMDLAGVECITVVGAAHMSSSDHGWNMVRLNGEWYCVDVTWDANYREQGGGRPEDWSYFNVTSDEMADSNHQWDYANTPEAVAEDRGKG